ncbi:MAG: AraC family transcriptional regulator [Ruminococcaceae bacterium]|nr:AraC family transcriptional regulator [Oscillospiraceae bacterium]
MEWQEEWRSHSLEYSLKLAGENLQLTVDETAHEIAGDLIGQVHNHPKFEVHVMLEGSCEIDVDGNSFTLRAGQAAVIAPGQYHRVISAGEGCRRLVVNLIAPEGGVRRALVASVEQQNVFDLTGGMLELCRGILDESRERPPFCRELMRLRLAELGILLLRLLNLREDVPAVEGSLRPISIIDNYFEHQMGQNPSADDLASKLNLSRRQLNRILKATYGMGFREKLLRNRMDQAKWLLRHTDKTVSAIAIEVGYAYDSAFREAFRREFAMTPQEYRLKHAKEQEELK